MAGQLKLKDFLNPSKAKRKGAATMIMMVVMKRRRRERRKTTRKSRLKVKLKGSSNLPGKWAGSG